MRVLRLLQEEGVDDAAPHGRDGLVARGWTTLARAEFEVATGEAWTTLFREASQALFRTGPVSSFLAEPQCLRGPLRAAVPAVSFPLRADVGARRLARLRRCVFVAELVRACIGSLNWLARGMPATTERKACPVACSAQRALIGSLSAHVMDFVRLAPCAGSGLSRISSRLIEC